MPRIARLRTSILRMSSTKSGNSNDSKVMCVIANTGAILRDVETGNSYNRKCLRLALREVDIS